jgi:hypothetical protein
MPTGDSDNYDAWQAAIDDGIDVGRLEDLLSLTPTERFFRHQQALKLARRLWGTGGFAIRRGLTHNIHVDSTAHPSRGGQSMNPISRWRFVLRRTVGVVVPVWLLAHPAVGQIETRTTAPEQVQARNYRTGPTAAAVRSAVDRYQLNNPVIRSRNYPDAGRSGGIVGPYSGGGYQKYGGSYVNPGLFPKVIGPPYVYPRPYPYGYGYGYSYPYPMFGNSYTIAPPGAAWSPMGYPGYGYYGYDPSFFDDYYPWIDPEYRYERYQRLTTQSAQRTTRLLNKNRGMMSQGLQAFAEGQYERALSAFRLAADMNKSDPAARVHAAHTCFALGRYSQAVRWLRDAFNLEPRLRDLPYDIRDDYGRREDFEVQLVKLKGALELNPDDVDLLTLLGYVHYYTDQRTEAYEALRKVKERLPRNARRDELVSGLFEACAPERREIKK